MPNICVVLHQPPLRSAVLNSLKVTRDAHYSDLVQELQLINYQDLDLSKTEY